MSKRFGEHVAVDQVSLEIAEGEFFSLLGPSGCGKTTTLRMLAGFEVPTEGHILLDQPVENVPPYKRDVNMVFRATRSSTTSTSPRTSRSAQAPQGRQGRVGRRVAEALELVSSPSAPGRARTSSPVASASAVALARALVNRPKVLLLDEPLGAT